MEEMKDGPDTYSAGRRIHVTNTTSSDSGSEVPSWPGLDDDEAGEDTVHVCRRGITVIRQTGIAGRNLSVSGNDMVVNNFGD